MELFEESDRDKDGKLSLSEFSNVILPADLEIEGLQWFSYYFELNMPWCVAHDSSAKDIVFIIVMEEEVKGFTALDVPTGAKLLLELI